MIDTPHNRRKMVHYILGMQRVINHLSYDDDPNTFIADTERAIEAIKADWGITNEQITKAKKYMKGSK